MHHSYELTLQILYRHLHSSMSRQSLTKMAGQTVAINGSSLLRNLVLKPNIIASPELGLPKNRHLQGFYEIGRYFKDSKVTPLFVFEDTNKYQGYGTEHERRFFLKDHGIQGLKFEAERQISLNKFDKILRDYLDYTAERKQINSELYKKAREEMLDVDELMAREKETPTISPKFQELLSESPHKFFELAAARLLTPHELAGEHVRNHLQRMGVQYERKLTELIKRLNIPIFEGSINYDKDALEYLLFNKERAMRISASSIHVLKAQTEDWGEKEEQVIELLKLLKLPVAYTSVNSADAVCSGLLGTKKCQYALTDNPFIMGYQRHSPGKKVIFNFMRPERHLLATDLGAMFDSLTMNLSMVRDYLFMCDGDLNQGFRGLEPDVIMQSIKKHETIEKVRLMFPNAVGVNFDCDRSRAFFDQTIKVPAELSSPYNFPKDASALGTFLKANDIPTVPSYTYFQGPRTVPGEFADYPINTDPKILSKVGTREHSQTKFPAFNRDTITRGGSRSGEFRGGSRGAPRGGFGDSRGGQRGDSDDSRSGSRGDFDDARSGSRGDFGDSRGGSKGGFSYSKDYSSVESKDYSRGSSRGGYGDSKDHSRESSRGDYGDSKDHSRESSRGDYGDSKDYSRGSSRGDYGDSKDYSRGDYGDSKDYSRGSSRGDYGDSKDYSRGSSRGNYGDCKDYSRGSSRGDYGVFNSEAKDYPRSGSRGNYADSGAESKDYSRGGSRGDSKDYSRGGFRGGQRDY